MQDRLHGLLGYADSNVAAFLITIARKHTSAASLYTDLQRSCGLSSGANVQAFAAELLERVPRKATNVPSALLQQQRVARDMVRKNASYGLLEGEDDEPPPAAAIPRGPGPAGPGPSSEREQKRQQSPQPAGSKHLRKKVQFNDGGGDGDNDDETAVRQAKRAKRKWEEEEDDDRQQETDEQREERLRWMPQCMGHACIYIYIPAGFSRMVCACMQGACPCGKNAHGICGRCTPGLQALVVAYRVHLPLSTAVICR